LNLDRGTFEAILPNEPIYTQFDMGNPGSRDLLPNGLSVGRAKCKMTPKTAPINMRCGNALQIQARVHQASEIAEMILEYGESIGATSV